MSYTDVVKRLGNSAVAPTNKNDCSDDELKSGLHRNALSSMGVLPHSPTKIGLDP
jgi:hypothetical protein